MSLVFAEPVSSGALVAVLFPLGWCLVLLILARVGGWSALAAHYAAAGRRPSAGETFYFLRGEGSLVQYKGTLILTASPEGVYLTNFFLFRPFHPPLLLPWPCVQALQWREGWFGRQLVLVIYGRGTTLTVFLPNRAWTAVRDASGTRFAAIDCPPPLG